MNQWDVFGVTLYGKRPRLSMALSFGAGHALLFGTPPDGPPYYWAWLPALVVLKLWFEGIGWLSAKEIPPEILLRPEARAVFLLNTLTVAAMVAVGVARYVATESVERTVLATAFIFGPLIAAVGFANLRHHQDGDRRP